MRLFNKKKPPVNVETVSKDALTSDKNNDGIPDYLQRENYASIVNSNKDFMKWESDVEVEIEQYIYGLMGYDFHVVENKWKPVSPPLMNMAGISYVKSMLRSIVNKHSINTFLSADDAHIICLYQVLAFIKTIKYRKKVYKINLADLDSVVMGFDNMCYIILSRSVEDKQRQHNDNRMSIGLQGNTQERL